MKIATQPAAFRTRRAILALWRCLLILLTAVAAVGCITALPLPPANPPEAQQDFAPARNRLLVMGADGNLFTIAADGSARAGPPCPGRR